ncbi:hypothetical protein EPN42_01430 [bacterium]|nr:MAG: hypothetical protein EPN42_01430 [bacterium]
MRQIRCQSLHGQLELDVPDAALGVRIRDGETYPCTEEQAAILLANPNFVDAATGKNPNFTCADCGGPATATALLQPRSAVIHPATLVDGVRRCPACIERGSPPPTSAAAPAAPVPTPAAKPTSSLVARHDSEEE